MRLGQTERRDALRLLQAALKNEPIEQRRVALQSERARLGRELTDDEAQALAARFVRLSADDEMAVLNRMVKRHRESIVEFRRGKREDLAQHEEMQLGVLHGYLPTQLGSDEIIARARAAVAASGARSRKDMGRVMASLADLRGKADMTEVSAAVRSLLAD